MNINEQVNNKVTLDSYKQCWTSTDIPGFSAFIEVLSDRLYSLLPDEDTIDEIGITIDSEEVNRININGTYKSLEQLFAITGQVVWVPKNKFFRGKLHSYELEIIKENPELDSLLDELDELVESEDITAYKKYIKKIEQFANKGEIDAIEVLAEQFADNEVIRDDEKAYYWSHIYYALNDYTTEFDNQEPDPDHPTHYCGKVDDFRNTCGPNELLINIGFDKAKEIDKKAGMFLKKLDEI